MPAFSIHENGPMVEAETNKLNNPLTRDWITLNFNSTNTLRQIQFVLVKLMDYFDK